jgi:glycine hydroxymethyltransferase
LEYVSITANKNSLPGDVSAINPGGVRLGTPALTTRGLKEDDFDHVAEFLHRACELAVQAQKIAEIEVQAQLDDDTTSRKSKKVLLKDFKRVLNNNEEIGQNIEKLKEAVESFSTPFYMPG